MEAKLKDGSILHVDAEERIYAQSLPGGSVPIVIDQAEGERLLIEFAEQQQQEIERLKDENNKLKDFIQENDVDRLENASDVIGEAMLEFFGEAIEDHKDFIKKKKENQESRDRILKSIEDQKQRFESRREKFDKHFGNKR